jgi:hypothetical protein
MMRSKGPTEELVVLNYAQGGMPARKMFVFHFMDSLGVMSCDFVSAGRIQLRSKGKFLF